MHVRRGGNCPNTAEVLQQLLQAHVATTLPGPNRPTDQCSSAEQNHQMPMQLHLLSSLPDKESPSTVKITESLQRAEVPVNLDHCLFRAGHWEAASSYIIRAEDTGSRTIVNFTDLPEMTEHEFTHVADSFARGEKDTWWHFEVRRNPQSQF